MKYPDLGPHKIKDIKHIAKAAGCSTPGLPDKVTGKATVKTIRNMMRKLMSRDNRVKEYNRVIGKIWPQVVSQRNGIRKTIIGTGLGA